MAKKGEDKNPKCATVIPAHWPRFTGPAWYDHMSFNEARKVWYEYLRTQNSLTSTPRIPRGV